MSCTVHPSHNRFLMAAEGSGLSLGNTWPGFAVRRGSLPSSKRSTARYCLLFPPPVVWSWEGPVFGVGVGPLCLIQSRLSLVACFHSQKSTSNVQDILQTVDAAVYGAERKKEFPQWGLESSLCSDNALLGLMHPCSWKIWIRHNGNE